MSHPPPAPPYRFGATITWVNGVGDIRQQFHTVTDGQAQSLPQLRAMLETQKAYNQPQPTRVSTDKPAVEFKFFMDNIPTLAEAQRELDSGSAKDTGGTLPKCTVDLKTQVTVVSKAADINTKVDAMRSVLDPTRGNERVVALDAEWWVEMHQGRLTGVRGKVALIQLGYKVDGKYERRTNIRVAPRSPPLTPRSSPHTPSPPLTSQVLCAAAACA